MEIVRNHKKKVNSQAGQPRQSNEHQVSVSGIFVLAGAIENSSVIWIVINLRLFTGFSGRKEGQRKPRVHPCVVPALGVIVSFICVDLLKAMSYIL